MGLVAAYGLQGTPRSRMVRQTIRAWFDVLKVGGPELVKQVRVAWTKAASILTNKPCHSNVLGLMSNLILLLLKAKWTPVSSHAWKDPSGQLWTMAGTSVSPDNVAAEINRDLFIADFQRAAGHYNGKGIADGIHINATTRVLRHF